MGKTVMSLGEAVPLTVDGGKEGFPRLLSWAGLGWECLVK